MMCVCFLRIFIHYLDMPESSRRRRYAYKFFAIFIVGYFLIMFAHVIVVAMWMMLASILRPTKMMPYGCAVLSLFILPIYLSRQMAQAAAACAQALRNFLDQQAGPGRSFPLQIKGYTCTRCL